MTSPHDQSARFPILQGVLPITAAQIPAEMLAVSRLSQSPSQLFVGVEQGILLAIALSLVDHTRHGYRPKNAVLVRDESGSWRPKPVATAARKAAKSGLGLGT